MSEEMKKQETMEDYMKEIDASFSNFSDDDMLIWDKLEQMKEDKTEFEVSVEGIVKGGVIAYVEGCLLYTSPEGKFRLRNGQADVKTW